MKVGIRYEAHYRYEAAASFSPHLVRLFPRTDLYMRTERVAFVPNEGSSVQYRRDLFDNVVGSCFYPEKLKTLDYSLEIDLVLEEKNPFAFLLASHAMELPFAYESAEAEVLAPYLRQRTSVELPDGLRPAGDARPTVEALVALNEWCFQNLEYERRDEGEAMEPTETLQTGRGACRDFAVLVAEVMRAHGVAARLASGFLWEPPELDASERRAASALHAWIEVYVPGPGWIGLDPTNGVFCNEHFMTTAVGLTPDDISPVQGVYFGDARIDSHLDSELEIKSL
ncbi:MAG: transglutaminase family protein [Chthoniobacterales bacterium]